MTQCVLISRDTIFDMAAAKRHYQSLAKRALPKSQNDTSVENIYFQFIDSQTNLMTDAILAQALSLFNFPTTFFPPHPIKQSCFGLHIALHALSPQNSHCSAWSVWTCVPVSTRFHFCVPSVGMPLRHSLCYLHQLHLFRICLRSVTSGLYAAQITLC